jgi:nitroreductase
MEARLTTKEAIELRRSIRKFKPDPVPDEDIRELLEAARLAPSSCNAQPWRFKVVKDPETKTKLAQASFNQNFIAQAPVVIICCADIQANLEGSIDGLQVLGETGALDEKMVDFLADRITSLSSGTPEQVGPRIAFSVAISIEHIILRALDFGLGTCCVRGFQPDKIKELFGWGENIIIVALLPLGYPAQSPKPRSRLPLNQIIIE